MDRLTPGERTAIVTLNEIVGSLSGTARVLGICAATLDRIVMGSRTQATTLRRVRGNLARISLVVHEMGGLH